MKPTDGEPVVDVASTLSAGGTTAAVLDFAKHAADTELVGAPTEAFVPDAGVSAGVLQGNPDKVLPDTSAVPLRVPDNEVAEAPKVKPANEMPAGEVDDEVAAGAPKSNVRADEKPDGAAVKAAMALAPNECDCVVAVDRPCCAGSCPGRATVQAGVSFHLTRDSLSS